ncbi:MAG: LPS assembly lipoprotein LptE [Rhodospirillales bacterium]
MSERLRTGVLVVALMALGACGFEPLYGQGTASGAAQLSGIRVAPIDDRIGQQLRNELRGYLTPHGLNDVPEWELRVELEESISEVLVEETSFATRADLTVRAKFRIVSLGDQPLSVPAATTSAIGSYNLLEATNEYANVVAERDARAKAIRVVARDIARQIAIWLRDEPWKKIDQAT